jgi:hypothetical protein
MALPASDSSIRFTEAPRPRSAAGVMSQGVEADLLIRLFLAFVFTDHLDDAPDGQASADSRDGSSAFRSSQCKFATEASDDKYNTDNDVPHSDPYCLRLRNDEFQ